MINKLYYYNWNIGFIENNIEDIVLGNECQFNVNWVKHNYRDRFFADPFILDIKGANIYVLVEEYPYFKKKGVISLLTINRNSFKLLKREVVLEELYHMSYPYIQRNDDNSVCFVSPEASMSGGLYRYTINLSRNRLENRELLLNEPALDSTIIEYNGLFWLFCTKRGIDSNNKLYIYYSESPKGPWLEHFLNPVVDNSLVARPAGYMLKINDSIYRVVQKNDKSYGETINITKIEELSPNSFKEKLVKQLHSHDAKYSYGFHTINGFKNICVVDGLCREFAPLRRILFELRYRLKF